MSQTFSVRRRVRFADCDPAGIAYYPRYFEICDGAVEDWCESVLEVPRRLLHLDLGFGLPTVDVHATFSAPSYLGDWLDITIDVTSVGRTSFSFDLKATSDGEPRFSASFVQVLMDQKSRRPVPWPEEWRPRLLAVCRAAPDQKAGSR